MGTSAFYRHIMAEAGMRLNAAAMLMRVGGSIPAAQSRVLWKHHLCSHLTQLLVSLGTQESLKGCSDWDVWIIAEKRDKNGIDWLDNVSENSMCTNWLMIEGTAFTTSTISRCKTKRLGLSKTNNLWINNRIRLHLFNGWHWQPENGEKKPLQALSFYIYI